MSADFNGTTSKLENTTADLAITNLITICAWVFYDGLGEGSLGRILCIQELNDPFHMRGVSTNVSYFECLRATTAGAWSFATPFGAWTAIGLSYDAASTANDPVVRVNFAPVTPTEVGTPAGTYNGVPATGYCVGNRTSADRTFDGSIQHMQVFNRILTATEMDQALRNPGSVTTQQRLWLKIMNAADVNDYSGNGLNATATALTDRSTDAPVGLIKKMTAYH